MNQKIKLVLQIVGFIGVIVLLSFGYNYLMHQQNEKLGKISMNTVENTNNINQERKNNEEEKKMEVLKLTSENYNEEVLNSDKPVLIDFYADWCGPCKIIAPVIEEIAEEVGDSAKVGKVNVDENQDLAMKYNVMSIPTILVIKNGEVAKSFVGLRSKEDLLDALLQNN